MTDNCIDANNIPEDASATSIYLPDEWILYLYDKGLFKKITNKPNFVAKPHKEMCSIKTLNDLVFLIECMKFKTEVKSRNDAAGIRKTNMDANDYIIMRKGIEPIWEDPNNCNGGTFTIKMDYNKGYETWSMFLMYMLGETFCDNPSDINGISVSCITDTRELNANATNKVYTYIKIWDKKPDRTKEEFIDILPQEIYNLIKTESLMYTPNNKKKHYGHEDIISKIKNNKNHFNGRGGFSKGGGRRKRY